MNIRVLHIVSGSVNDGASKGALYLHKYLLKNGVTQIQTWFPAAINNTPSGQAQPASPASFKGSYFTYAPAGLSAVLTCSANDTIVFGYDNRYSTPIDDASVNAQIILIG